MLLRLQKNHYLVVFISFFLSLCILLCVCSLSSQPVHAVAGVDDVVLLALATFCLSMGISISVNLEDWSDAMGDLYDFLSENSHTILHNIVYNSPLSFPIQTTCFVSSVSYTEYSQLASEIIDFFHENSFDFVPGTITPTSSDGKIGFTSSNSFSLYYPRDTNSCSYVLPSGTFTIYDVYNKNAFPACAARDVATAVQRGYIITNSDGFGFCQATSSVYSWSDCTFTPYLYNNNNAHDCDYLRPSNNAFSVFTINSTSVPNTSPYEFSFYFDSLGNIYRVYSPDNRTYYFLDINSGSYYQNLSFASRLALVDWFRNSLGLVTLTYGSFVDPYSTPSSYESIDFDEDTCNDTVAAVISTAQNDNYGNVSLVIPSSESSLSVLSQNPSAVTDVSEASQLLPVVSDLETSVEFGFSSVLNFLSSIVDFISNFWDNLVGLFIPPPDFWNSNIFAPVFVAINNKFNFIQGFQNWLLIFQNTEGQPLFYQFTFMGQTYHIDFSWYSDYRLTIRACFQAIFYVLASLKCLKLLSSAFHGNLVEHVSFSGGASVDS